MEFRHCNLAPEQANEPYKPWISKPAALFSTQYNRVIIGWRDANADLNKGPLRTAGHDRFGRASIGGIHPLEADRGPLGDL